MTLDEARKGVGRKVVYKPTPWDTPGARDEGVITSVNDRYVFVRYGSNSTSSATYAGDLVWSTP